MRLDPLFKRLEDISCVALLDHYVFFTYQRSRSLPQLFRADGGAAFVGGPTSHSFREVDEKDESMRIVRSLLYVQLSFTWPPLLGLLSLVVPQSR